MCSFKFKHILLSFLKIILFFPFIYNGWNKKLCNSILILFVFHINLKMTFIRDVMTFQNTRRFRTSWIGLKGNHNMFPHFVFCVVVALGRSNMKPQTHLHLTLLAVFPSGWCFPLGSWVLLNVYSYPNTWVICAACRNLVCLELWCRISQPSSYPYTQTHTDYFVLTPPKLLYQQQAKNVNKQ